MPGASRSGGSASSATRTSPCSSRAEEEQPEPTPPEARGWQAGAGTRLEIDEGRWLINPGSVGQPRDGDPRAAWLELDTEAWQATYHRVAYDIDRAAEAIEAAEASPSTSQEALRRQMRAQLHSPRMALRRRQIALPA